MFKVLIPTDGSAHALLAAQHALRLVSQGLHARFVVANVQDPATLYEMVVAHDPAVLEKIREAAGLDLMSQLVAVLRDGGQQVDTEVATGDPAHLLVDILEAHGCQAVIMAATGAGAVGLGGTSGTVSLGTVARDMLALSPVPVTVVKPPSVDDSED
jgi:nucleotide-binding universal stress UspA family protein